MTAIQKSEGTLGKRFRGMAESIGPMDRHIFYPGPFPLSGRAGAGI